MYETILSPINYGGLQLKNRIIFAPTTFGLSDEEYLARIRSIAEGGCAMIIVGDVPVGKSKFEKSLFDYKGAHKTVILKITIMASVRRDWERNNGYLVKAGYSLFFCRHEKQ